MVTETELMLALTGMGVAAVGGFLSAIVGLRVAAERYAARRLAELRSRQTIDWPQTWDEILADNGGVPPLRSHKSRSRLSPNHHRLRCGVCGRFAARVQELPGVGQCRVHGMSMTGPIITIVNSVERQEDEASHQLDHA